MRARDNAKTRYFLCELNSTYVHPAGRHFCNTQTRFLKCHLQDGSSRSAPKAMPARTNVHAHAPCTQPEQQLPHLIQPNNAKYAGPQCTSFNPGIHGLCATQQDKNIARWAHCMHNQIKRYSFRIPMHHSAHIRGGKAKDGAWWVTNVSIKPSDNYFVHKRKLLLNSCAPW